jgi:hypothetical protein
MLAYRIEIKTERSRLDRSMLTTIRAITSEWAAEPYAEIRRYSAKGDRAPTVSIIWGFGGRNWTVKEARKFFRAGIAVCQAVAQNLRER